MQTFFHEFGHVMHGVLSETRFNSQAGTATQRDFVEAPSQMYEEWASRMESLSLLGDHCSTCPPIDESLVARLKAGVSPEQMAAAMALYPLMKQALGRMTTEGAKIDGTAIMTTLTPSDKRATR